MKTKFLFILPLAIAPLTLFSCGEKVSSISATVTADKSFKRDGSISKTDIKVEAKTNNGDKTVESKDWTSDKFGKNDTYTFTTVGENIIDIKYGGKSFDLKVNVKAKYLLNFDFTPATASINVGQTTDITITMKDDDHKKDISSVVWSIGTEIPPTGDIEITPNPNDIFKCTVKGKKAGTVYLKALATSCPSEEKTNTMAITVTDTPTPPSI